MQKPDIGLIDTNRYWIYYGVEHLESPHQWSRFKAEAIVQGPQQTTLGFMQQLDI
jgi:hypothetical protein